MKDPEDHNELAGKTIEAAWVCKKGHFNMRLADGTKVNVVPCVTSEAAEKLESPDQDEFTFVCVN